MDFDHWVPPVNDIIGSKSFSLKISKSFVSGFGIYHEVVLLGQRGKGLRSSRIIQTYMFFIFSFFLWLIFVSAFILLFN